jgi:hypothetical protein
VAHRVSRQRATESEPEFAAIDLPDLPALRGDGDLGGGVITRVRAWARRGALDAALAAGADPSESPVLAYRAARLTGARSRRKLAAWVAETLATAGQASRGFSAAVEPDRHEVLCARERLLQVKKLLESPGPVYVQGVALLKALLSDGGSCLYVPRWPEELSRALDAVIAALEGREEDVAPGRR